MCDITINGITLETGDVEWFIDEDLEVFVRIEVIDACEDHQVKMEVFGTELFVDKVIKLNGKEYELDNEENLDWWIDGRYMGEVSTDVLKSLCERAYHIKSK
jgi:hypothetical protein